MSSLASLALCLALVATAGLLFAVHLRLKSAGSDLVEYRRALVDIIAALGAADAAVCRLMTEGQELATLLAQNVAAAEAIIDHRSARLPDDRPGWRALA